MHYKFLRHSTGSGQAAIEYLLGKLDHRGRPRELVQVLRGDPYQLGRLIDSLQFVHRYTSGVIALHPDDACSDEKVQELITDFERIAFAGLNPDEYAYCVVRHDDHFHVIVARVNLLTGHSLNIAPPGWQKPFDTWRDYWNQKEGWARPDDPARARDVQPGGRIKTEDWAEGEDITQDYASQIIQAIQVGEIPGNRAGVVEWLNKQPDIEVKREAKESISILIDGHKRNTRLKGRIFARDFDGLDRADLLEQRRQRDLQRAELTEAARVRFEEAIERRTASVTQEWEKRRSKENERRKREEERAERDSAERAERAGRDRGADAAGNDRREQGESAPPVAGRNGLQTVRKSDCFSRRWKSRQWRRPVGPLQSAEWAGAGRRGNQRPHHQLQQLAADRVAAAGAGAAAGTGGLTDEQRRSIDSAIVAASAASGAADRAIGASERALGAADHAAGAADRAAERADHAAGAGYELAAAGLRSISGERDSAPERAAEQGESEGVAGLIARIRDLIQRAHEQLVQLVEWLNEQLPDPDDDDDQQQSRERPGG